MQINKKMHEDEKSYSLKKKKKIQQNERDVINECYAYNSTMSN